MNADERRYTWPFFFVLVVLCLTPAARGADEEGLYLEKLDDERLGFFLRFYGMRDRRPIDMVKRDPHQIQHARPASRPYLFPIPVRSNADVPSTWRDGLSVGLRGVNGTSFWDDGNVHPRPIRHFDARGMTASWVVQAEWRSPAGEVQLYETQRWTLSLGSTQVYDLAWELVAARDVEFSRQDVGGLTLRMPWAWDTSDSYVENDMYIRNRQADGLEARWVLMTGPAGWDKPKQTIVMMDHPDNPARPAEWRVHPDDGIAASRQRKGAWRLAKGQTVTERHRVLVMSGRPDRPRIEAAWKDFAAR